MKNWHRLFNKDLGSRLYSWRHKSPSRFFMKILTWLLGGFVFGILAAIFFDVIGLVEIAQNAARIVFFITFLSGVVNAFYRFIINGVEFIIMQKGLVAIKPVSGLEKLAKLIERFFPRLNKSEYLEWQEIKEIKEGNGELYVVLEEGAEEFSLGVSPCLSVTAYNEDGIGKTRESPGGRLPLFYSNPEFDKDVLRRAVQKARFAKKMLTNK